MSLPEGSSVDVDSQNHPADDDVGIQEGRDRMVSIGLPDYNGEPITVELELGDFELELILESNGSTSDDRDDPSSTEEQEEETRGELEPGNAP